MSADTSIHLTKSAAALRLLRASIRMLDSGEDALATIVVASAAGRVLSDLAKKRGIDVMEFALVGGLFELAKQMAAGGEPDFVLRNPDIESALRPLADRIRSGDVTNVTQVNLSGFGQREKKSLYDQLNKHYNFLKHADWDSDSSMMESDVSPIDAVSNAALAYHLLFPVDHVEEFDLLGDLLSAVESPIL